MTHTELCERACSWLRGSRRCGVVLSGIASTEEIPDAIGWSTSWRKSGSTVIECKVSLSDFRRDKLKKHDARIGNRRYFMVPRGLVSAERVATDYPDHGLLWVRGRIVTIEREAMDRPDANLRSENRLLYFALVHLRANVLAMGCAVDVNLLSLHPFTVRRREAKPDAEFDVTVDRSPGFMQAALEKRAAK
jgi:hypothetical protein